MAGQGRGEGATEDYSLVANSRSCMQKDGVGLYRALGWGCTGEGWGWGSGEHASQKQTSVWAEKPMRGEKGSWLQNIHVAKICQRKEQKEGQGRVCTG